MNLGSLEEGKAIIDLCVSGKSGVPPSPALQAASHLHTGPRRSVLYHVVQDSCHLPNLLVKLLFIVNRVLYRLQVPLNELHLCHLCCHAPSQGSNTALSPSSWVQGPTSRGDHSFSVMAHRSPRSTTAPRVWLTSQAVPAGPSLPFPAPAMQGRAPTSVTCSL